MRQDFAPGDRLGRYELVATIGGGGFASVWRARTEGIGGFEREFAVKVLRQGRASRKRFQDMLLDEARLVARIEHPNVAQIFEVGEDPRSLYFVMELVDGDSLDELAVRADAAGKSLPVRALFRVLADASAGLHAAHELSQDGQLLGLVHRDVSPQNILVSRAGIAKLIDFGIAKAKERLAPDTTTGYIKGKISFMAPEQARSEEVDRRADVWAMGAVAYELLEGRPPFDAGTDLGRLAALVGPTPVPPLSDRAPLPLRRVVERCLQKDVASRYATALQLKEAIEEALIEAELETSVEEAAVLLEPYFHRRRDASLPSGPPPASSVPDGSPPEVSASEAALDALAATVPREADTTERAVSSTIELRARTETIEIPRRKTHWPWLGVAAGAGTLGVWLAVRPGEEAPRSPEAAPPETVATTSAGAPPSTDAQAPQPLPDAPRASAATLAPSLQPSSLAAPSVALPARQPSRPSTKPTPKPTPTMPPPTVDPDAIE